MTTKTPITVAHGDGIGPEIMAAVLHILDAAGAQLEIETIDIGEKVYKSGTPSGIADSAWESLERTKCFLKAPITTPQGGGFKSLNVTVRKTLGMFANIRPCVSYAPYVRTLQPKMDMVIVRENEEDIYAGIEHRQTTNTVQALKLISRAGSEKIIRYAFEYARLAGRKKVSCISKDNIMKMADGLFHKVFDEIRADYPDIESDHWIVDIGAARIASRPEQFDVIVTENLYGDILSDIAAEVAGSVGLCGSANIGRRGAMFEAIHGSAPDIAGKGIANPSGLLHGALLMLQHIGQTDVAENIHNAWLRTLEDGMHTGEIASAEHTVETVGTDGFAKAVVARLGRKPEKLPVASYGEGRMDMGLFVTKLPPRQKKELVGVDVFLDWSESATPSALAKKLNAVQTGGPDLSSIAVGGLKVWPYALEDHRIADHWCCRYMSADGEELTGGQIAALLAALYKAGFDVVKTDNLYHFDGERGFSLAQGD
jgi:isocitrate dehydrogenase